MTDNWQTITIGELCDRDGGSVQTGPFGSQLHASDYLPDGVPFVMPANLGENRIVEDEIARVSSTDAERLSRYRLKPSDIIYGRRGDIGRRAFVTQREDGWICGSGCIRIRLGDSTDSRFVSYLLGQAHVKELILARAVGSTMPNLNSEIIRSIPLVLPPLPIQRRVADLLGALDDKIECNRRMNQTLEAMAQALYKHWFVDFGPFHDGTFEDSEVGRIPKGWSVTTLYDCAVYTNGAAFRDDDFSTDNSGLPIVKIAELKNGITGQTKFTNKELGTKYQIHRGDILFSWSGSPDTSIDIFVWAGQPAWLNQHTFKVGAHHPREKYFICLLLRNYKQVFVEIARNKQTTGLGHVTVQDLKRIKTAVPTGPILDDFNKLAGAMFEHELSNEVESSMLARTRDYLLPRLLSGEVELKVAEKQVEASL